MLDVGDMKKNEGQALPSGAMSSLGDTDTNRPCHSAGPAMLYLIGAR